MDDFRKLGEELRAARLRSGYTQKALAEELGMAPASLKNIEGGRRIPSVQTLLDLCQRTGYSLDGFVLGDDTCDLNVEGLTPRQVELVRHMGYCMSRHNLTGDHRPLNLEKILEVLRADAINEMRVERLREEVCRRPDLEGREEIPEGNPFREEVDLLMALGRTDEEFTGLDATESREAEEDPDEEEEDFFEEDGDPGGFLEEE